MSLLQQVPIERSLNSQSEEGLTKKESNCSFLSETGLRYYEDHVFESEKPQKKKKKKKSVGHLCMGQRKITIIFSGRRLDWTDHRQSEI